MRIKVFFLFFLLVLQSTYILAATDHTPKLYLSPDWTQGQIGTAILYPAINVSQVTAQLMDPDGTVCADIPMFFYKFSKARGTDTAAVVQFGLGPQLQEGLYSILIRTTKDKDFRSWEASVFVTGKKYKQTTVRFRTYYTKSNEPVSPERQKQAKRFYQALNSYHVSSIFDTGSIQWPITDKWRLSSDYGERRTFIYRNGKGGGDIHDAQDMAAPSGTPVYAAADGRVLLAENRIATGNTVIMEHLPGVFTLYYHMNDLKTKKGKQVKKGDLIGHVGSTGFSTGPHLHFSVWVNGYPVEPGYFTKHPLLDVHWMVQTIEKAKLD